MDKQDRLPLDELLRMNFIDVNLFKKELLQKW